MSIFVICLFLGSSASSFPHSSNSFFRIGNLRRFSELADPPDFNSILPIPNSFRLIGLVGAALRLRPSWFAGLSITMRSLKWNWTRPRKRLCMPSITMKRRGSQYGKRSSSDHRTPVSLKIQYLSFFVSTSLHCIATARCSWCVLCFHVSHKILLISDFCNQHKLQKFAAVGPAKPPIFRAAGKSFTATAMTERAKWP